MTDVTRRVQGIAVVTGASRGLGLEFVRQLVAAGRPVVAACRTPADLPLAALGDHVTPVALDVSDSASVDRLGRSLAGWPIDLLINNAALRGATGGLPEIESQDFLSVMAVNVLGPLLVTRALLSGLRRGKGLVANISSRSGSMVEGIDPEGDYAYKCSKAALNMATVKLADDTGLTVVSLHPGWVRTDMGGPDAELDTAHSVASMLALLARLGPDHSGTFLTHDGKPVAW